MHATVQTTTNTMSFDFLAPRMCFSLSCDKNPAPALSDVGQCHQCGGTARKRDKHNCSDNQIEHCRPPKRRWLDPNNAMVNFE